MFPNLLTYDRLYVMTFHLVGRFICKVYWPKRDDVGKILRVECTPVLGDTRYSPIFAISSLVSRGIYF